MTSMSISRGVLMVLWLAVAFVSTLFVSLMFWFCAPFTNDQPDTGVQDRSADRPQPAVTILDAAIPALYKRSILG